MGGRRGVLGEGGGGEVLREIFWVEGRGGDVGPVLLVDVQAVGAVDEGGADLMGGWVGGWVIGGYRKTRRLE